MEVIENASIQNNNVESNKVNEPQISTELNNADSSTSTTTSTSPATKLTITDYLTYFVHSLECTELACTAVKCKNFKRLFCHFKQCKKHFECESCRWLLNLIIIHSKSCDNLTCNIPLCFTIKARLTEKEVFNFKTESIREFISRNLDLLKNDKLTCQQLCQTASSTKRKFDQLDDEKTDPLNTETAIPDKTQTEPNIQQRRNELLEQIRTIKQQIEIDPCDNKETNANMFEKNIRNEIVKYMVETSLKFLNARESAFSKNAFIPATILIIRKERDIFAKVKSSDDYLILMADIMNTLRVELVKRMSINRKSVGVQVNDSDFIPPDGLPLSSDNTNSSNKRKRFDE